MARKIDTLDEAQVFTLQSEVLESVVAAIGYQ